MGRRNKRILKDIIKMAFRMRRKIYVKHNTQDKKLIITINTRRILNVWMVDGVHDESYISR